MSNLGKGALYLSLSSLVFMASGYVINVWLGKTLGPASYGIYGVVITLLSLINIMQTAGLPQALAKFVANGRARPEAIFGAAVTIQLITTVVLSLVFVLMAKPLALLLGDDRLLPYLLFSALVFPLYSLFAIYMGYYNGLRNFKRQALMNVVYSLAKVLLVIVLTVKFRLFGAIAGFVISPAVALVFGIRDMPKFRSGFPWKGLFWFSVPLVAFAFASTALLSIDLFIAKIFLRGDEFAGYYTAAQNVARLPYYALNAVALVLLPGVAALIGAKEIGKARRLIENSLRYVLLLLLPASCMLIVSGKAVISVLFSAEYLPGLGAFRILVVAYALLLLFTIFSVVLSSLDFPGLTVKIAATGLVVTVVACALCTSVWGLAGAAIGTAIGALCVSVASFVYLRRAIAIRLPVATTLRALVASVIASLPLLLIGSHQPVLLFGAYMACGLLYGGLLYGLREIDRNDLLVWRRNAI